MIRKWIEDFLLAVFIVVSMWLFIAVLFSAPVKADDFGVIVASKHFVKPERNIQYNEANPGLYYSTKHYVIGVYVNSFSQTTYFFGQRRSRVLAHINNYKINGELDIGVMYGYAWENNSLEDSSIYKNRILTLVVPSIVVKGKTNSIHFHLLLTSFAVSFSHKL